MPVFNNILAGAAGQTGGAAAAGPIKSVRFNSADSTYLNRTPSSASNRKTWTWAAWIKLSKPSSDYDRLFGSETFPNSITTIRITQLSGQEDCLEFHHNDGTNVSNVTTNAKLRDVSAWYHIVVAVDTTQATAADRTKIYINGVEQSLSVSNYLNQNVDTYINSTETHNIGRSQQYGSYFNGYMAGCYLIDGSALDPTSFGAFDDNGVWQAAAYSGTFGTNGFHLFDFANESGIGDDSSGNENDFTANNISTTAGAGNDVLRDVPTNGDSSNDTGLGGEVSGNYATLNPLVVHNTTSPTFSNGNLEITDTGQSGYNNAVSTIGVSSGKWYVECTNEVGAYNFIGIQEGPVTGGYIGNDANGWSYAAEGYLRHNSTNTSYGSVTYGAGDVIGIALDLDSATKTLTFYKNGTSLGTAYSGSELDADVYHFGGTLYTTNDKQVWNFGQRPFAYTAPSGFKALCTTNLPTPTIADGSTAFDAVTYTGNNSTQTISGLDFSPDLVWLKRRSGTAHHHLYDIVRGATKRLQSSTTNLESTAVGGVTAFNSDGWTMGNDADINGSSNTFVGWTWDAGSSTASNTDGSITSSVRANQSAGFSIISYTGTGSAGTIGHSLNAQPHMVIVKNRSTSGYNWKVLHKNLTGFGTYMLSLDTTGAETAASASWFNSTAPTNSVISLGSLLAVNGNNEEYICYAFAPVAGYSAFGSYTAGGASNPAFVYTGFRPAFILYRFSNTTGNWAMFDSKRNTYNVMDNYLFANSNAAEASADIIDFVSNGFKIRAEQPSGNTVIYACFAENPFQANGGLAR